HPSNEAGMAVIAIERVEPFAGHAVDRLAREAVRTRHLGPYKQPEAIGPEEVSRIFELLMFANTIEAHRFRQFDITSECGIVGSRHSAVGPITLVEDEPHQVRTSVEQKPIALDSD